MAKWSLEVAAVLLTLTVVVPKLLEYRAYWKYQTKLLEQKKQPDQAGLLPGYRLQNGGDVDAIKDAYLRAQMEGRAPV